MGKYEVRDILAFTTKRIIKIIDKNDRVYMYSYIEGKYKSKVFRAMISLMDDREAIKLDKELGEILYGTSP
jgi:hypothetical protein